MADQQKKPRKGHSAAGKKQPAQDTKPLEALEQLRRIVQSEVTQWDGQRAIAAVALLRAALVRAEESERDAERFVWWMGKRHASWNIDQWRAAIDAARAAQTGGEG